MAYIISDECISCGDCESESECPTDCISEGPEHYEIDPDMCIDCGVCADVCRIGAISSN